VIFETNLVA